MQFHYEQLGCVPTFLNEVPEKIKKQKIIIKVSCINTQKLLDIQEKYNMNHGVQDKNNEESKHLVVSKPKLTAN